MKRPTGRVGAARTRTALWPGVFVSFEAGRALTVSIDYEIARSDLRASRSSPCR